ncbi:MAG TPA: acetylornithine deacetylase [Candidatus Binataceae bacterium]|nr:acetylornithine deacetylase [Candidatus Binataceae bacterium]
MADHLYDTIRRLIAFDTVSANSNIQAAKFLADRLDTAGFKTTFQDVEIAGVKHANLVAWAGPLVCDGLMLSGHIDTVPFEGQPGWTRDPLKADLDGDRLYGRGASDMKGFIAQCIDAAMKLDRRSLKRPVVFLFTADEEVGCRGAELVGPEMARLLDELPIPRLCWIGEPTSYGICHTHKSIGSFEIRVNGRGGHSGAPAEGVNAIAVMGKVMKVIGALQQERASSSNASFAEAFPESPYDVLNLGTISGGIALNMIAEECRLRISYRSLPDVDPRELHREIERRLREIDPRDFSGGSHRASITVGRAQIVPPLLSERGTTLERALAEVTGAKTSRGALYGTDGGHLALSGITSLICGPGDLDQAHQPNESIRRDAFERGPEMILRVIDRMCGAGAP